MKSLRTSSTPEFRPAGRVLAGLLLLTLLSAVLMFLLEGLGYWPSTAIAYAAGAVMSFSRGVMNSRTGRSGLMRVTR